MLYYTLLLILFFIFSPISNKNEAKHFVTFSYFVLLLFASLRFGIGTDYFSYSWIFFALPENFSDISFLQIVSFSLLVEPGFSFLMILFKSLNLPFSYFIVLCAFISLGLTLYTIQKYSINKLLSLFIFFANYYMVYIESALRQGIAMTIFLYAFYDFLYTRKKVKYYLLIILGMTIHVSILITLCIPFIVKIHKNIFRNPIIIVIMVMLSLVSSIFMPRVFGFIISIFSKKSGYFDRNLSLNIFPIGLRLLEMILVYILFRKKYMMLSEREIMAVKVYISGVYIYLMVSSIGQSRVSEYFTFIEIILLPNLLSYVKIKSRQVYRAVFLSLFIMLFYKDMYSFIDQRNLKSKRIIDYQYVTIFNKEKIKELQLNTPKESFYYE
jgi:hypothetical protein